MTEELSESGYFAPSSHSKQMGRYGPKEQEPIMATQVIWNGNDKDGFFTSHLVTGSGRHTQYGHLGPATGRPFVSRTIADCMGTSFRTDAPLIQRHEADAVRAVAIIEAGNAHRAVALRE